MILGKLLERAGIFLITSLINLEGLECKKCHKRKAISQYTENKYSLGTAASLSICLNCTRLDEVTSIGITRQTIVENTLTDIEAAERRYSTRNSVTRRRRYINRKRFHDFCKTYDSRCYYCLEKSECITHLQPDHYIPFGRGGLDDMPNIVPACQRCNSSKSDKFPWKFKKGEGVIPKDPSQWKLDNKFALRTMDL
jgi:5-methylcytosine-specific restriction endonuclease McrA